MFPSPAQFWPMPGICNYSEPIRPGVKRKTELIADPTVMAPPPEKHFVTEEEMSAEMKRLQLLDPTIEAPSSACFPNYQNPEYGPFFTLNNTPLYNVQPVPSETEMKQEPFARPFTFNVEGQFTGFGSSADSEMEKCDQEEKPLPRVTVCEEVLKIKPESVLPLSLLNMYQKNTMALVPWVPPLINKEILEEKKKNADDEMDVLE